MPDVDERCCTKCDLRKPLAEFSLAPRGKYGRKASCKACDAARHALLHPPRPRKNPGRRREEYDENVERKTCTRCGRERPLSSFSVSRRATDMRNAVYRSHCKACQSDAAMEWFRANPGRTAAAKRRANLAAYGITEQQYTDMLRAQGGVCAICGKPESVARDGVVMRIPVDHCHDSGKVRGLLCHRCNRAIGLLGDDPVLMRKAISYLLRHKEGAAIQGGQ